jgi:hypothetical protein
MRPAARCFVELADEQLEEALRLRAHARALSISPGIRPHDGRMFETWLCFANVFITQ